MKSEGIANPKVEKFWQWEDLGQCLWSTKKKNKTGLQKLYVTQVSILQK